MLSYVDVLLPRQPLNLVLPVLSCTYVRILLYLYLYASLSSLHVHVSVQLGKAIPASMAKKRPTLVSRPKKLGWQREVCRWGLYLFLLEPANL